MKKSWKMSWIFGASLPLFWVGTINVGLAAGQVTHGFPDEGELKTAKKSTEEAQKNTQALAEYHFSLAEAYASDGNLDQAIEEFKLTLMFDSSSPLVYTRLAAEYVKKGMFSEAMETCKEAIHRDSNYTDAHLILAGLYSATHEIEAALSEYNRILKINPKNEEAVVYKSQILVDDGRTEEGAKVLRQFIKSNPESPLALYYLGRTEQQRDNFKEAVLAYRKAMVVRSGFSQAALALGYLYEEKQMNAKAVEVYKELYNSSEDVVAASRIATIYLKQEKYQEAIPYLEAIQAEDSDDMNVRVKLGLIYMELKNYDKSISIFKEVLAKNPDAERIHYYLGSIYEELKKVDLAVAELKVISPNSKLYVDSVLHICYLLKESNKIDEAKEHMRKAIEKAPRTPSFYIFQASLEEETQQFSSATQILQKATQLFPDDEKIHYYLGSLYDHSGDIDKSLEQMEAILRLNPENVDALNYIGYTWTQKGIRLNDAAKLLKRALALKPKNGYIQDSWGWYLFTTGKVKEAVVQLEKAVRLKPNEPTILEHLGDAYLRSNLREKALVQYRDAAKYAENLESRKKLEVKADHLIQEIAQEKQPPSQGQSRMPAADKDSSSGTRAH